MAVLPNDGLAGGIAPGGFVPPWPLAPTNGSGADQNRFQIG